MTLHRAVGCDTDACLALYVAAPQLGPDAALYATSRAGWSVTDSGLATCCPSWAWGGLPALEAGECPACRGRTTSMWHGEECQYCGHVAPHPLDELANYEDQD